MNEFPFDLGEMVAVMKTTEPDKVLLIGKIYGSQGPEIFHVGTDRMDIHPVEIDYIRKLPEGAGLYYRKSAQMYFDLLNILAAMDDGQDRFWIRNRVLTAIEHAEESDLR